ncbi:MAG: hypothetical protein ACI4UL_08475 [Muribaculaceae bacterium]
MNKVLAIMIAVLMSISLSSFAGTKTSTKKVSNISIEDVNIPDKVIVRQHIIFDDGKDLVVYYEKQGQDCKLYSKSDLSKYGIGDLMRIKATRIEKTDYVEGNCQANSTMQALISMARGFLK